MRIFYNTRVRLPAWLVAAVAGLSGCSAQQSPAPLRAVEVGFVTLQSARVALQSELPGRTAASLVSDVRPQVSGIVKARLFEEGAQVNTGQVLYLIDAAPYQAAYDQANADVANAVATAAGAKSRDDRYTRLLQVASVSRQDADDARSVYQQAVATVAVKQAALESARINLGYTKVLAPIAGRIGKSSVTAGALVTSQQTTALATIRTLDPIYVDLTQSSAQLLRLRRALGMQGMTSGSATVRLKLEDGSVYEEAGTLKFQEVTVDEATGSVTLRAQFPNHSGVLLPGMYVRATFDEAVNGAAILAPQQGIAHDSTGNAVALVVAENNRVEQRTVVTERAIGDNWLIVAGLAAGDRLIVEGLNKVHAGDAVRPVAVESLARVPGGTP